MLYKAQEAYEKFVGLLKVKENEVELGLSIFT